MPMTRYYWRERTDQPVTLAKLTRDYSRDNWQEITLWPVTWVTMIRYYSFKGENWLTFDFGANNKIEGYFFRLLLEAFQNETLLCVISFECKTYWGVLEGCLTGANDKWLFKGENWLNCDFGDNDKRLFIQGRELTDLWLWWQRQEIIHSRERTDLPVTLVTMTRDYSFKGENWLTCDFGDNDKRLFIQGRELTELWLWWQWQEIIHSRERTNWTVTLVTMTRDYSFKGENWLTCDFGDNDKRLFIQGRELTYLWLWWQWQKIIHSRERTDLPVTLVTMTRDYSFKGENWLTCDFGDNAKRLFIQGRELTDLWLWWQWQEIIHSRERTDRPVTKVTMTRDYSFKGENWLTCDFRSNDKITVISSGCS